jgi:ABC-type proline/glycine betaine transport system permease subunit
MRWIYDLFLGILILADRKRLSLSQSVLAGLAILSPWLLVVIPEMSRWDAAMLGIPLIWSATVISFLLHEQRES